jgi:hypothetical protein
VPYNMATGTSQVIAPHKTVYAGTLKETHFSVFLERSREEMMAAHAQFGALFVPAERERTERRDRTGTHAHARTRTHARTLTVISGNRYSVRSIVGHTAPVLDVQLVDPVMKALSCSASGEVSRSLRSHTHPYVLTRSNAVR